MATIEKWVKCNLGDLVKVQYLDGNVFSMDNSGNLIGVHVYDKNGSPVTLAGEVTVNAIRADGNTVIFNGQKSGNDAWGVLPQACYYCPGPLVITIKLSYQNTVTTLACVASNVYQSSTDSAVDPGHVIPSISELLAKISACETATASANSAASSANNAAASATTAASTATTAASTANSAASSANSATSSANSAASTANTAAAKINNMTVAASGLSAGAAPTVTISEVNGHKHIAFGIPKGDKGDKGDTGNPGKDFEIRKTFASIAAMQAYDPTQDTGSHKVRANDFVMIDTGSVEDVDTGKLYCYEPEQSTVWHYIGDLSGKQGIKGETGTGIANIVLNQDYTLTITMDDGTTSYTTSSIRGATGATGATPSFSIGTVQRGDTAAATITGTAEAPVLNLTLPKGDQGNTGATPDISIGTVTTLNAGSSATASMTGTAEAPVLNLGIPRGYDATISSQSVVYGTSSSASTVPSSWVDTMPTVAQGDVLWVKKILTWNDNTTTEVLVPARQGMDGSGTVSGATLGSLSISPTSSGILPIPVDALPTENSANLLTSGRLYTEISSLSARIDALDPESGVAIFTDLSFSIATTDWTLANSVYTAVVTNATLLTQNAGVQVFYNSTLRSALTGDIYVDKATGTVTFTTLSEPKGTLTGFIRIIDSISGITPVSRGGTGGSTPKLARANLNVPIRDIPVNFGTVSSLPQTVYDADLTASMVAFDCVFGNPAAIPSGIDVTFATGSVTIAGTLVSGASTTIKFWAHEERTAVEGSSSGDESHITDFVSVNAQSLTNIQKSQVRTNIGLGDSALATVANNATTTTEGYVADARQIAALNGNLTSMRYNVLTSGSLKTWAVSTSEGFTCFRYNDSVTDTPCSYGHGYVVHYGQNIRIVVFNMTDIAEFSAYSNNTGSSWSNWEMLALNSKITTKTAITITPASNVVIDVNKSYLCGEIGVIAVTGHMTSNSLGAALFTMDLPANMLQYEQVFPIAISSTQWSVGRLGYGYVGTKNIISRADDILSGEYFHVDYTFVLNR